MSYNDKFQKIKKLIIQDVKDEIIKRYNYNKEFNLWSYSHIKDNYISKFKEEISQYINANFENELYISAINIGFAIRAYININSDYKLDNLLIFIENFLTIQLDEIMNWGDSEFLDSLSHE